MNAMQFAFAAAIGSRNVQIARTLRKASPLRRRQLAAKLGADGAPLDNAALDRVAKSAPVEVVARPLGFGLCATSARVATFAGMVQV
jgi:hypothetical protein